MNNLTEDQKAKLLERKREHQRMVNLAHRLNAQEDFRELIALGERIFRVHEQRFSPVRTGENTGAYCPLSAALADGATTPFIFFRKLLSEPVVGDANHTEPPVKVKRKKALK